MSANINHRIALGTVQFGLDYGISNAKGKTSLREVTEILDFARDQQITLLDTAAAYGNSEEVIGQCTGADFQLVSKFIDAGDRKAVRTSLLTSLEKLKRQSLYAYLAHHANSLIEHPVYWEELLQLREDKLVKKIGYSLYTPAELEKLFQLNMIPDLIQIPFSLLDQRFAQYFKLLKERSVEIHVRSAFLQGLLLMDSKDLGAFFNPVKPVIEKLTVQFPSIEERAAALLLFCLQHAAIDKVVMGVNTKVQLERNLTSLLKGAAVDKDFEIGEISEAILMPNQWPK
ncbi:aldo/keto reductase [Chryseotalea sanaruensis]|uniref:Aldo/keto reductase n=1 Tax=Chryseotalea sanaruensis TaxID=2482724 RepID=A0A401U6M7_9BACT|nr:aldo/keto reductase [Chryseotalea sanaruensis]GCC50614.1 aldo/keto reductase [Chryseotalea sanaruensis]